MGLYNYFGLPDDNRMWQNYFIGCADSDSVHNNSSIVSETHVPEYSLDDESRYSEDNENMLIIRALRNENGKVDIHSALFGDDNSFQKIEDFELADYYLVRGNSLKFGIYPFIKKRGKRTEGISGCVFEYDYSQMPIKLDADPEQNESILKEFTKLYAVISFAAMLLKIDLSEIYKIDYLASKLGYSRKESYSLFDLFKMLGSVCLKCPEG